MLRLLSTSTARLASRATARSSTVLRALPCACSQLSSAVARPQAVRGFAKNAVEEVEEEPEEEREPVPFPEARTTLLSQLAKEKEELSLEDPAVAEYLQETNTKVQVDLSNETVLATRSVEGYKVQVLFRAQPLDPEEAEEEEAAEEEEKMPEHRFNVDLQHSSGRVMRIDCFNSPHGELEVGAITFHNHVSTVADLPKIGEGEAEHTPGALNIQEMSEETNQALFDFLEGLGVDDDLAFFVASQAQLVRAQAHAEHVAQLKEFAQ